MHSCPSVLTPAWLAAPSQASTLLHPTCPYHYWVQVISQVRFSDLDVPTDAEVLLATLKLERKQHTAAAHVPSTYVEDLTGVLGEGGAVAARGFGMPLYPAWGRLWALQQVDCRCPAPEHRVSFSGVCNVIFTSWG